MKTSIIHEPNEDKKLQISLPIPYTLFKELCSHASIRFWADVDKTEWKTDVLYIKEFDEEKPHRLDYKAFCRGIAKILEAECIGRYDHRFYSVMKLLSEKNPISYDAEFADDIVQFCVFGRKIY